MIIQAMLAASSYQSNFPDETDDDYDDEELDYKIKKMKKKNGTNSKHDGWLKRGDSISSVNHRVSGSGPADMVVEIRENSTASDKNHNSPSLALVNENHSKLKNGLLHVIVERDKSGKCFFFNIF